MPIPQGSLTRSRYGKTYADNAKRLYPWRDLAAATVRSELDYQGQEPLDVPADVRLDFWFPRPAKHYGRRRRVPYLREDAPPHPSARYSSGDLDKLARAALDALTMAGALHDDALVIDLTARKRYADESQPPGMLVVVRQHDTS